MAEVGRCAEARRGWGGTAAFDGEPPGCERAVRGNCASCFPYMLGCFGDPSFGALRFSDASLSDAFRRRSAFSFAAALYRNPKI